MADKVIICGIRRGGSLVEKAELKQMQGRAGRNHGETGKVVVLCEKRDEDRFSEMTADHKMIVNSCLSDTDLLTINLLPSIVSGEVSDISSMKEWESRSFQKNLPMDVAVNLLEKCHAIEVKRYRIYPTEIGRISSKTFIHPFDLFHWKENFERIWSGKWDTNKGPAFALGSVPFDRITGDVGEENRYLYGEIAGDLPEDIIEGSKTNILVWWSIMGGSGAGNLKDRALERRKDRFRFIAALKMMNRAFRWDREKFFDELEIRIAKGISEDLLWLCRYDGITRKRAKYLVELGCRNIYDLPDIYAKLGDDIDDGFRESVGKIVRELC